jgi:hypothetical protein
MIEAILGTIFKIVGELLVQLFLELLAELGLHAAREPFRRAPHPGVAAIGYFLLGAIVGLVSLWPFPAYFVHDGWRIVNLALAPVGAGLAMSVLGGWRARRGQDLIRLDRFGYGYLFALALGLVRFWFAH